MTSEPSPTGQPKAVRLGKYEIIAHLARGGVGSVYRARETATGREYAIKVLLTKDIAAKSKETMIERFRREARHAAKLQHENIVRVYDFCEHQGAQDTTYYIVMEFVDGVDLSDHIESHGTLDPEETRDIMIQACRALQHAHEQGIVHRDVKPSNFMLTKRHGRPLVKLLDLGLARTMTDDEARVTRVGTTVGTVDYISPEQARESSSADIRSDLYSLGCTWFHMLSGQPPFGAGGLAERILKHLEETPPDVRQFNPRASKALVKVLNKLLEKNPRDRYQTPDEVLHDLTQLIAVVKPTKDTPLPRRVAESDSQIVAAATKRGPPRRKGKKTRHGNEDTLAEKIDNVETSLPARWLWLTAAMLSIVLLGAVALVVVLKWRSHPADNPPTPHDSDGQHVLVAQTNTGPKPPPNPEIEPEPVVKIALPSLVPPNSAPIDIAKLRERLDIAFPKQEPANTEPLLRIQRTVGGEATAFATLADALATTPLTLPVTVEIQDNGPLFWSTTGLGGRKVTVRAAKGYRPLIVWDVDKTMLSKPVAFLTVADGGLHLEDVDVVVQWPDKLKEPLTLVQAMNSDFSARNCTFSLSGRHDNPVAVVRFVTTKLETHRCRFIDCVLRGNNLQALDLDAPGGLVLFENCLMTGGEFPLLQVRSGGSRPATVFAVRSTLVGSATLVRLQGAESTPSLNWLSWDCLLSRSNDKAGGELLALPPGGTAAKIKWEPISTLYAGWQTLLTGAEPIRYERDSEWRIALRLPPSSSDRAIAEVWPAPHADLSEVSAAVFKAANPIVAFAATVNNVEPIGCVPDRLPPLRNNWKSLVYERVLVPPFDVLENDAPATAQVVDVSTQDLGLFLQKMQDAPGFGPKVLRLKGTGVQPMTPVKLKGVQLTLYFEQSTDDARRLILTPALAGVEASALLEIEGGGLDVINGEFVFPDGGNKIVPSSLFKVSGGDLRLCRCRLIGPQLNSGPNYRGLIQFEGSGEASGPKGRQCVVNESVLVTDKTAVLLHGVGARLLVKQSVFLAGGPALQIDPGPGFKGRANVQCVLTSSSVASRQAILQVDDEAAPEPTVDPIVIQSMQCAFLAPFKDANPAGVARFGGNALAHGLFVWQSDSDLFDARFHFGCLPLNVEPSKASLEWPATCRSLFGPYAATRMKTDAILSRQIDPTKSWALEQLLLTPSKVWPSDSKPPAHGADLLGKGFVKKPKGL